MVNDSTREYSVYISDEYNTHGGSGVLFYAGGESVFVFTCAHVVDNLEKVRVFILKEKDASRDLYETIYSEVSASQILYSPLDEVRVDEFGGKIHTEDIAIIRIRKPEAVELSITNYYVTETYRNHSVIVQGYPNGVPESRKQIEHLDELCGRVVVNPADSNRFTIRMIDTFIDAGARVCEMQGLSGAPVWDDNEDANGLLGVFTSAYDTNALLSKTYVTKAQQIRSIMKDQFNIVIKRKLEGIPEEDVAGGSDASILFNETNEIKKKSENETWIEEQLSGLHVIIEDLKLQKAIDRGKQLVEDYRYKSLCKDSRKKIKQYLLYCYEIADLDEEFELLESEMRIEGLIKEHDILRQLTRTFMKRQFEKTVDVAQQCIDAWEGIEEKSLLSFAKIFLLLTRAYTENLPIEETIDKLLDENEKLIYFVEEAEGAALIYQMIGYVYGEHYHDYVNSIRFLNRAYRVGDDSMVLESLGAAYYNLGVYDATDADGKIPDWKKIDQKALYKARECYLVIKSKADNLFWAGTMRRMGLCVFNTFVFLQDNYRIFTIYQDIKKYLPDLSQDQWRDVEMKYAVVSARKGEIDTREFQHITAKDCILVQAIAKACKCSNLITDVTVNALSDQAGNLLQLEKEIREAIEYLEDVVRQIDPKDSVQIYVEMINLYGSGMRIFGWKKKDKMVSLYEKLSGYADLDLMESMGNYLFEIDGSIEAAEKRFKTTFEKHKNIITWQELNHFYIRHNMFGHADDWYRELFSKRRELIEESPEYAYRAFIDYITLYRRDLKYALRCYLDAKKAFKDTDIEGFLELELMLYSNSFNTPERFEVERKYFADEGLVTEESYHRVAFIAYLVNLNVIKACEHNNYIKTYPHFQDPQTGMLVLSREEIHFLNWIGAVKPGGIPSSNSMLEKRAEEARSDYAREMWHKEINRQFKNQFGVNKVIAIDSWSLYQLTEQNMLDILEELDCVYVSHLSIIRLLDELSVTGNPKLRILLDYLKLGDKIELYSAGFEAQLEVRNAVPYSETASAVAVAVEKDCLMVYGEPVVEKQLIEHFGNRIIRMNQMEKLL